MILRHDEVNTVNAADAPILRVPPHSIEAEECLIAAVVLEGNLPTGLHLKPADFYRPLHAKLWVAILCAASSDLAVNTTTVIETLRSARAVLDVEPDDAVSSLRALVEERAFVARTDHDVASYARIIRAHATRRALIHEALALSQAAYDGEDAPALLEEASRRLSTLSANAGTATAKPWPWETDSTMSSSRSDVSWVLRGFLARGALSLLVGQPKAGKSWLVYALLAAMERGDEEFIGYPLHGSPAVVLSEEPPATILGKRKRFGGVEGATVFLTRTAAFPPKPLRVVVEEAVRKAKEIGAEVLVVDTWAVWAHLPPDAEKDAGATQAALEPLLWAASLGLAVLVVHHMKKADGEDGTSVRGSSALLGTVDILIELRRFGEGEEGSSGDGKAGKRALKTYGRYEECPEEVIVELAGDRFISRGTAKVARVVSLAERVVEAVCGAPQPLTFKEVAGIVGVGTSGGGKSHAALNAALRLATDERRIQTWLGAGNKWNPTRYAPPGAERPDTPPGKAA